MGQTLKDQLITETNRATDRVYSVNPPTPLEPVSIPGLGRIFLKREDLSCVHSYKWRGAFNKMAQLKSEDCSQPVVTASAGNHAQGVALAARILGMHANIYMPVTAPQVKQDAVRLHGGDAVNIILTGDTYNQTAAAAKHAAVEDHKPYIPAFDDLYTIAGQGTMGTEIVNSGEGPFDFAFLQIGGGGMAAGVSTVLRAAYPGIRIIGIEGEDQACMKASLEADEPVTLSRVDTFCDGTAVTRPGDLCFELCRENLDAVMTVNNRETGEAIKSMIAATRSVVEPSGAMGLAGAMKFARENPGALEGKKVLTIISGANIDNDKLAQVFANAAGSQTRRHLRFEIGEERGSLLDLVEEHFADINISAFQYGKVDDNRAWPVIAFDADQQKLDSLKARLDRAGVEYSDVTGQPDASSQVVPYNPHLFRNPLMLNVEFPERKGALREFLQFAQPAATNICYFNYAYTGDMVGSAMICFEFDDLDQKQNFLERLKDSPATCSPVESSVSKRMLFNNPQNLGL